MVTARVGQHFNILVIYYVVLNSFSASGIIEGVSAYPVDSGVSVRNELSHLK